MTPTEAALREALEHMRTCANCAEGSWEDCEGGRQALKALAATPHDKGAGEEPEGFEDMDRAAIILECETRQKEIAGLQEALGDVQAEIARRDQEDVKTSRELGNLYTKVDALQARLETAEGLLLTLVDAPDWSNTSFSAVCAFLKEGGK